MILGQRIALDPNKAETRYFWRAAGVNRKAWNWGKSEWDEDFAAAKALETIDPIRAKAMRPSAHALKAKWAEIRKTEFPWSFEVTKCAGTQAILDLGVAYARAAKERADAKREGRKPRKMFGFPKYKSRTKSIPSFALWNDQFQIRNVYGFGRDRSEIRIPNLGWVRLREPVKSIGGIMGARISYHRGRWFVAIQHDLDWNDGEKSAKALNQAKSKERKRLGLEATDPLDFDEGAYQRSNRFLPTHPMSGCVGGVDAGLSSLVTTTVISAAGITTTKTPRVRHDARTQRQTRIENRRKRKLNKSITRARIKLAAKKLGIAEKDVKPKDYRTIKCRLSKNQSKLSRQIAKVQGRSSDCRRDTSHKVSTEIARSAEIIVIEELAVAVVSQFEI
jgi:hypothetical protein